MRFCIPFILLLVSACAHEPLRAPANEELAYVYGEVDENKSKVKVFPPKNIDSVYNHFFYIELKDSHGKYVDADASEFTLKKSVKKTLIPFLFQRLSPGRYYLTVVEHTKLVDTALNLEVRRIPLKTGFKLGVHKANRKYSKLTIVNPERSGLKMKLFLGDSNGKPVELSSEPEILLEGHAEVVSLERVGKGTWEFDLVYPNTNQVIYVSVRAHGTLLPDMIRIQHLEK